MNQTQFIDGIRKEIRTAHADMVKLADERDRIKSKVDDGIWQPDFAQAEIEAVERKMQKRRDECEDATHSLIAARLEELDAADTLKGEELNPDCQLLQFVDLLTQKDVAQLAKRNGSNPTASRLIARYAEAHGFEVEMPSYLLEAHQAKKEAQDVQEIVHVALKWIGDKKDGQRVLERLFPQIGM